MQPVIFFGQGQERFGKHDEFRDVHRHFSRLRPEHKTFEPHDVPDVVILFIGKIVFLSYILSRDVNLNRTALVRYMRKGSLPHHAAGHHSSRHRNGLSFIRFKIPFQRLGIRRHFILGMPVGILSLRLEFLQLVAADLRLFDELFFLRLSVGGGIYFLFFHR